MDQTWKCILILAYYSARDLQSVHSFWRSCRLQQPQHPRCQDASTSEKALGFYSTNEKKLDIQLCPVLPRGLCAGELWRPLVDLDNDLLGFPPLSIFALTKVFPPPNQARKLESTRPYCSYPRNLTAQSKEHPHRFSCFLCMQEDERELLSVFWALCPLRGNAQHSAPHKGCNSACEGWGRENALLYVKNSMPGDLIVGFAVLQLIKK